MRRTRHHLWSAAGLVLAATGPALAQGVPQGTVLTPVPAASACESCVSAPSPWQRLFTGFNGRAERVDRADKLQKKYDKWGYPAEFEAPPPGALVDSHFHTMVANGQAARMVLYRYDFVEGTDVLNVRGRDQLAKIAALVGCNGFPIVIERLPESPELAEARRQAVVAVLGMNGLAVPPDRVVVGKPISWGLDGPNAIAINGLMLRNLNVQGTPIPAPQLNSTLSIFGSGGGGGAFGGGGQR